MEAPFLDIDLATDEAFEFLMTQLELSLDELGIDHKLTIRKMAGHRNQKLLEVTKTSSGLMVWKPDNSRLSPGAKLSRVAMAHLRALGFQRWKALPGHYVAVFPLSRADRVSELLVEVVRSIHGVIHPALLTEPVFPAKPVSADEAPPMPHSPADPVVVCDQEHLSDLIAHVCACRGLPVEWDADRVARAHLDDCVITLSAARGLESIRLTASLSVHVSAPSRLQEILDEDGREFGLFDVALTGTQARLETFIQAQPFHTDFILDLIDEMLAERAPVAREITRLLHPDPIKDDPLIRPDGLDE